MLEVQQMYHNLAGLISLRTEFRLIKKSICLSFLILSVVLFQLRYTEAYAAQLQRFVI